MNNILITGGTGFVGYWLSVTKPQNVTVTYLGRKMYEKLLAHDWTKFNHDGIMHLAPVSPIPVIQCTQANNARLLYCSSGIVYHPEHDTLYRHDKIAGEFDCLASGVDVVLARLFTFFGERLDDYKAITTFQKAARANKPLEIYGDGTAIRSYMHGYDMGKMIWSIFERGESKKAYDVGSLEPITMLDLAKMVIKQEKSRSKIVFVDAPVPMPYYLPHKEMIFNG